MTIFVFNPDTDYALASNSRYYTPTKGVIEMRRHLALLHNDFASEGDAILLLDEFSDRQLKELPGYAEVIRKGITIITLDRLHLYSSVASKIIPWGWNLNLQQTLLSAGVKEDLLPDEKEINRLRELSHRRTCLPFRNRLQEILPDIRIRSAKELFTLDEVNDFISRHNEIYIKFPWSSSGRGVMCSRGMRRELLLEWAAGSLRRQQSVMVEEAYDRAADFASEWYCENGKASFAGLSFFHTANDGRYMLNEEESQEMIFEKIKKYAPRFNTDIINAQKIVLEEFIAPEYNGPAGIDMLADKNGEINPCVEINLRYTMGHVALARFNNRK